jgi:hypothetical protein
VHAQVFDDPHEGRSIIVDIGARTRQLLQISRWRAHPNMFGAAHGFTGRVTARSSDGGELSYACASVE